MRNGFLVAIVSALISGGALISGAAPARAAGELKIGYVNIAKVFDGYDKTKSSEAALTKKGQQKEAEFNARMAELNKMKESLELLTGDARETKARELEERADSLKRFRNNTARDLQRERNVIAQGIVKEINSAVDEYAKANAFNIILDERSMLFSQGGVVDVSGGVVQLLNGRLGKKPAS